MILKFWEEAIGRFAMVAGLHPAVVEQSWTQS